MGFWGLCGFIYPRILTLDQPIVLIISLTFVATTICYFFVLRGTYPILFFVLELAADVCAQTVLVYMMSAGGAKSSVFTIYIAYCAAGGLFYNDRVALAMAALIVVFYSMLTAGLYFGWIPPFSHPLTESVFFEDFGVFQNLALLLIFLGVAVYGIRLAAHFTKIREKALEAKNRELIALNRISSLTRSGLTLERVQNEVVRSVHDGMGYPDGFLLYQDPPTGKIQFYFQEGTPLVQELKSLGVNPSDLYLPIDDQTNQVYAAMKNGKLILRNELSEVLRGANQALTVERTSAIQHRLGYRKFVAAPLIAEGHVVGALIGACWERWLEADAIRTFEGFADQAALTLDNAMLIAELKLKNIELERVSRVKSEFLATMSHELRTPLTAIIGFSELLLEEVMGAINGEQKESLREILVNGENLLQMINGLLDFAKIESGKMEVSLGPIDFADLLTRVQRMIASLLHKKSHRFEAQVPPNLPILYADEKKLQQILLNLISNAIKFTPNGGKISVSVTYRPRLQTESVLSSEAAPETTGILEVSVEDTGIGIRKQDQDAIFESFRQVDSSFTREYQGTGLGLALVKQFVTLQGGSIRVESEVGRGSKFIFSIPNRTMGVLT